MAFSLAPFRLDELQREWIVGTRGDSLVQQVQVRIAQIEAVQGVRQRGVLIAESDPVVFAVCLMAAVHLRVPVVLANPKWRRSEWAEVAESVNPALIFGECPLATERRRDVRRLGVGQILVATGGSTGGVRFAIHTWKTLVVACGGLRDFVGDGPMHVCCVLPLFHVSGLMQLVRSFVSGGQIAFFDFKQLLEGMFPPFAMEELCLSLVPTQLQRLMAQERLVRELFHCRMIFVGGAAIPDSVAEQARLLKLPVFLTYGMTETAAMVTVLQPDEFQAGGDSCGRPLKHVKVEVLDAAGKRCAQGEIGRIRIRGRSICRGYRGGSGVVGRGEFFTGDEGYCDAQGRLHVIGRADRLIISGGEKIDPQEVAQAVLNTGAVAEVLVLGCPDAEWGQKLVAFYVTKGVRSDELLWEQELRADLANYKIPKVMVRVDELPYNERGKVDWAMVRQFLGDDASRLEMADD